MPKTCATCQFNDNGWEENLRNKWIKKGLITKAEFWNDIRQTIKEERESAVKQFITKQGYGDYYADEKFRGSFKDYVCRQAVKEAFDEVEKAIPTDDEAWGEISFAEVKEKIKEIKEKYL